MLSASTPDVSPRKIKTYKELANKNGKFKGYKTGDQLPLFEMPAVSASRAITNGLGELHELLAKRGHEISSFDDLYSAGVHICGFVGAKERKALKKRLDGGNENA